MDKIEKIVERAFCCGVNAISQIISWAGARVVFSRPPNIGNANSNSFETIVDNVRFFLSLLCQPLFPVGIFRTLPLENQKPKTVVGSAVPNTVTYNFRTPSVSQNENVDTRFMGHESFAFKHIISRKIHTL